MTVAALALVATPNPAPAKTGTAVLTGANTGITAGWRGTVAGAEFLADCLAGQATGGSAIPVTNGQGAFVVDMGSPRTGFVSTEATIPVRNVGPPIPTPDPTGLVFPSPTWQLHNFDLDLYFVSAQCSQVGSAVTQASNEAGFITVPARYVVILLAFNATGGPSVTVGYSTP